MPNPTPRRIHTPWQLEVEKIEQMIAETRRSPEYQRQHDWYLAYYFIDIETGSKQPGFSLGFQVGLLYAQCEKMNLTAIAGAPRRRDESPVRDLDEIDLRLVHAWWKCCDD